MNKELIIKEMLSNMLKDVGKIMLTSKEMTILDRYDINYRNVNSLKELIFLVEKVLSEEDYPEDLEDVSRSIAERDYYQNTNK